jgi:hypothetical protein
MFIFIDFRHSYDIMAYPNLVLVLLQSQTLTTLASRQDDRDHLDCSILLGSSSSRTVWRRGYRKSRLHYPLGTLIEGKVYSNPTHHRTINIISESWNDVFSHTHRERANERYFCN